MTGVANNFGREILWGATQCVCLSVVNFLGKAKIYQFQMSVGIDKNIFGLQIAVCDPL